MTTLGGVETEHAVTHQEGVWRDARDVQSELVLLRAHKSRLMPGTEERDHHAAIDAQMKVLSDRMSEVQVIEHWGTPAPSVNVKWFIAQEALVASKWVSRSDRMSARRPSTSWDPFLIERRKSMRDAPMPEQRGLHSP